MQSDGCLSQPIVVEEVIQHADNCVCPLANVRSLVNDEVDLSWDGLTTDPKQGSLPGSQEVDWARLEWVDGVVNLHTKQVDI